MIKKEAALKVNGTGVNRREVLATGLTTVALAAPAGASVNALAAAGMGELGRYIEDCVRKWGIPGASVAVMRGSETIYLAGHGVRQFGLSAAVDAQTLFQIGSTSKAFAAAVIGLLVQEGKLNWDDRVQRHLPDFALSDEWISRNLTICDLLTHRSGFPGFFATAASLIDRDECIRRIRFRQPTARFRDSYLYNNVMYGVAEAVIEAASGERWADLVSRALFKPLAMNRTRPSPYAYWPAGYVAPALFGSAPVGKVGLRDALAENVAMPHTLRGGTPIVLPWQSYDNLAAAGSIVSNATDMANWVKMHLNAGKFAGQQILKEDIVRMLHAPHNLALDDSTPFDQGSASYALGWRRRTYRGQPYIDHSGGILGFPAFVAMLPEQKLGIVVLANGFTPYKRALTKAYDAFNFHKAISLTVFDRILGNATTDWQSLFLSQEIAEVRARVEALKIVPSSLTEPVLPTLALTNFAGIYRDLTNLEGKFEIRKNGSGLELRFSGAGAYRATLLRRSNTIFLMDPVGSDYTADFIQFQADASGQVKSVRVFDALFSRQPAG